MQYLWASESILGFTHFQYTLAYLHANNSLVFRIYAGRTVTLAKIEFSKFLDGFIVAYLHAKQYACIPNILVGHLGQLSLTGNWASDPLNP